MGTVVGAGGRIEVESEVGKGSEFVLRLPVPKSVLIISSLLVKLDGRTFSIPQESVSRVISLRDASERRNIKAVGTSFVYQETDGLVPVVSLRGLLGAPANPSGPTGELVRIRCKTGSYCLEVDEVLEIEDTVVKQVGPWLHAIPHYAGATFLADGRIGLVLHTERIAEGLSLRPATALTATDVERAERAAEQDLVLLFDLGTPSVYGVAQKDIFRLEEFAPSQVQYSGAQPVVIYREQAMPLVPMNRVLGSSESSELAATEGRATFQTIVVRRDDRFVGYVVRTIRDFAPLPASDQEGLEAGKDRQVRTILGQTVTVVTLGSSSLSTAA
jgi:two-component system chemotaxis sensor kinase CheA